MKYDMLYDRLLVRVLESNERTSGGLWIPQMAIDGTPWQRGEVVAVGHGRLMSSGETIPLRASVGDVVIFFRSSTAGEQMVFPSEGEELLCIREPNILCILRDLEKASLLVDGGGKAMVLQ